jgi:hypothetical protein
MSIQVLDAGPDSSGGYKIDVSRGARVGRVSSEWFSRPDDERFLSLTDLHASMKGRAARSRTRTVASAAIRVEGRATMPSGSNFSCRRAMRPSRRRIGPSAS